MQFTSVVFVNTTNTTMTAENLSEYLPGYSGHLHIKLRLRGLHNLFQMPRVYDGLAFVPASEQGQDVFLPNLRLIHRSVLTEAVGEPVRRFPIQVQDSALIFLAL